MVVQDFRDGRSDEEIERDARWAIYNVAHLKDHILRWARQHGKDARRVDEVIDASRELKVVIDLANEDKHGPPRQGGLSGFGPTLREINRVMRLSTGTQAKSFAAIALTAERTVQHVSGSGTATVIVTADIVDRNERKIGDLHDHLKRAMNAWETLLSEYGVSPPDSG